eukprot:m.151637 g.151637  ORF g.151637 m.151637 type:complete len:569 (+) comp23356_c0_seq1:61-1767(+)
MDVDEEYGIQDAPRFRFVTDGEEYILATDFAKAFGKALHELFGIYPSLSRRKLSSYERAYLGSLGYILPATCTVLRAIEVDEVLANRTARNISVSLLPEHIAVARPDRGYLLTQSVHKLDIPQSEAGVHASHRVKYGKKKVAKPGNLLKKSYGSIRGMLRPKAGAPDLVPIMINLEQQGLKFKDQFLWDKNDDSITPRTYAAQLCKDEELPLVCADEIATSVQHQLETYGTISDVKLGSRLVTINLNVQLGTTLLQDKFVWDHAEEAFTPEQFAERLCFDLGVGGGFIPLVGISIREQLIADKRRALQEDLGEHKPPITILQLSDCYHLVGEAGAEEWSPSLSQQSWSQLEKQAKVADREARLRKRNRGDDNDALGIKGRRSGRARRDVSYAPKARRSGYNPDMEAAEAASTASFAADADLEAAVGAARVLAEDDTFDTPLPRVVEHISARRGVDMMDDRGLTALHRLAGSAPQASATFEPGAVASLRHAGVVTEVIAPVAVLEDYSEPVAGMPATPGEGTYKDVPRGYYKDNYLNRRLGRVGQKKNNYGTNFRNEFYFAGGTTKPAG